MKKFNIKKLSGKKLSGICDKALFSDKKYMIEELGFSEEIADFFKNTRKKKK